MIYADMPEWELRVVQAVMARDIAQLRAANKHVEVRQLREQIIGLNAVIGAKVRTRKAEERRIAESSLTAQSTSIEGEAAAALTEVERILGG